MSISLITMFLSLELSSQKPQIEIEITSSPQPSTSKQYYARGKKGLGWERRGKGNTVLSGR
jgi:hypothetical protein